MPGAVPTIATLPFPTDVPAQKPAAGSLKKLKLTEC